MSSRHPVVAPSPSSSSRSVSLPGVSRLTLLVSRLRRGVGCPSRSSDRFGPVGRPTGCVILNARELLAVKLGLHQFQSSLQGRTVAVFCATTTAVAYLRKEGGTRSPLLHPSVRSVEDLGVMASGHRPLPSHSLCGHVSLPDGDHSVCAPVGASGGLDGLHHSDGSVPSSAGSSSFS